MFAVFPSTVMHRTEPSFELTQSSPNISLKTKTYVCKTWPNSKLMLFFLLTSRFQRHFVSRVSPFSNYYLTHSDIINKYQSKLL